MTSSANGNGDIPNSRAAVPASTATKRFSGDYFCMKAGDRWPSLPHGFNDQISSIRVFHGALVQVFENGGFTGRRLRVDHDVDSLVRARLPGDPAKSWNDRISAIAVYLPRDVWDQGHP